MNTKLPIPARHARRQRRISLARGIAVALVAVLSFSVTAFGVAYSKLQGNIQSHDVSGLLTVPNSKPAPAPGDTHAGAAINLLLMGSDDREGTSEEGEPDTEGRRNDTTLLLHIAADRSRVQLVSIPRDLWVDVPSCKLPNGSETRAMEGKFNSSFSLGGQTGDVAYAAACTMNTVMKMSGITLDGFYVVNFNGFKSMVNALGGVQMTLDEAIHDDKAGLSLDAGNHLLNGDQALGFARARYSLGDGSDIGRIGRQQELIAHIFRTAMQKNVLTSIPDLYRFLEAATKSLTASKGYGDLTTIAGIAWSIRGIDPANIQFATVPWTNLDGSSIKATSEAPEMWKALQEDKPFPANIKIQAPLKDMHKSKSKP